MLLQLNAIKLGIKLIFLSSRLKFFFLNPIKKLDVFNIKNCNLD